MEKSNEALIYFLNYGAVGAMLILLLLYTYYTEKKRQKNITEIVAKINQNNSDSVEELKTTLQNYITHLQEEIKNYKTMLFKAFDINGDDDN